MTTFEKCKMIQRGLLIAVGEITAYNWSIDFKVKNVENTTSRLIEHTGKIDPNDLTLAETKELGFGTWSQDNPMRLIPLWLFPFLADEFTSYSISGSVHKNKSDLDNDHRFGCLAYGITPKN